MCSRPWNKRPQDTHYAQGLHIAGPRRVIHPAHDHDEEVDAVPRFAQVRTRVENESRNDHLEHHLRREKHLYFRDHKSLEGEVVETGVGVARWQSAGSGLE